MQQAFARRYANVSAACYLAGLPACETASGQLIVFPVAVTAQDEQADCGYYFRISHTCLLIRDVPQIFRQ